MTDSIKLIVVDLDGTLLNTQHELTLRTAQAIQAARDKGVQLVLATGKTRPSALSVIARLDLDTPGIYVQGLVTYGGDGSILNQFTLDPAVVRRVITYAEDRGFSLIAYSGANMFVRRRNHDTDLVIDYGEPEPQVVGALQNLLHNTPINKVMAVKRGDARAVKALRWQLQTQLDGAARLMQAGVPDMVEVLPRGGSKGAALKALLRDLKIDPQHVMAIGDGENDIEMMQHAGIGVAVGNADQPVRDAADHVVASNDEDGVAEAIERFVLGKSPASETAAPAEDAAQTTEDTSQTESANEAEA